MLELSDCVFIFSKQGGELLRIGIISANTLRMRNGVHFLSGLKEIGVCLNCYRLCSFFKCCNAKKNKFIWLIVQYESSENKFSGKLKVIFSTQMY